MGTLDLDFRPIGDDGRTAYGMAFDVKPRPVPVVEEPDWSAPAGRVVQQLIENRARRYERRPALLNGIPTLSPSLSPEAMIARADALLEQERDKPTRWLGFGGESPEITLRAVRLYAERQMASEAA